MRYDYDLFVIGGGSGGVRAARLAAGEAGKRVGLAEDSKLGGTCVQRGCVPKKLMVFASEFPREFEDARSYGWDAQGVPRFEWLRFRDRLHEELRRLETVYGDLLSGSGVTVHAERAVIEDAHTVGLASGKRVTAEHILVATGGHPARPDTPGAEHGIVSDDMFDLDAVPEEMLIVGGGYIACEFACIMNGLGSKISVYNRGEQILRGFDDEAREIIADGMRERGITVHTSTQVSEMGRGTNGAGHNSGRLWTRSTTGVERQFDAVLFATGRIPSADGLGLEAVGVSREGRGAIEVDRFSRTAVPSIWAIGDVTDRMQLTPVAIREAVAFVRTCFQDRPTPVDHEIVPSAVFTQPEMGAVGLTEQECSERPHLVYATAFRPMKTAFAQRPDRVMMKLIVDAEDRRVLGCHVVSPQAAEIIQLAAVALKMGATKEDFDATCAVHPTMAEEIVTMKAPVRSNEGYSGASVRRA